MSFLYEIFLFFIILGSIVNFIKTDYIHVELCFMISIILHFVNGWINQTVVHHHILKKKIEVQCNVKFRLALGQYFNLLKKKQIIKQYKFTNIPERHYMSKNQTS